MDLYSQFIHQSRYARWDYDKGRRENWPETVARYIKYFQERFPEIEPDIWVELEDAIVDLKVMPSMRCLMTAGPALEKDQVAGYNCAYAAVDDPRVFDEILYVLMCGTGVGFSVERQYVSQLPKVAETFHKTDTVIKVPDSKIGWAKSFRELVSLLYAGLIPEWDVSELRPAGAPLRTFGGRSSGPAPLVKLFNFTVHLFQNARGRRLSSVECHDLVCKIAEIVVVGGVRRSALISLSNLSDDRMRHAKTGQWWNTEPQRALANNSAVYNDDINFETFMAEWLSLYESKAGERGIFSREASKKQAARNGRRDATHAFGTNPCSEIILRSSQFCNLSEVVVRSDDTLEDLKEKVRLATILGTLQSTLTNFRYLRNIWKENTEEERLLGVSLTGICDNTVMLGGDGYYELARYLTSMKDVAIKTNEEWAEKLGVPQSTAITCVKPSGTVSQLVNSASGIHPRYAPYYVRRVRNDKKDPLTKFMIDRGVPAEEDVMNSDAVVLSFPIKSPDLATFNDGAKEQLWLWEQYQEYWCEHKPSITVYYTDDEFLGLGQWVWDALDEISGISFLPKTDHIYQQAPYEEISQKEYQELLAKMPTEINWAELSEIEIEDNTTSSQELACVAGMCEL